PLFNNAGHQYEVFIFEPELAQRVALVRVEASRDEDEVRSEFRLNLFQRRFEHAPLIICSGRCAHRHIQCETATAPSARLAPGTCARIPRVLMHREEEDRWVIIKN